MITERKPGFKIGGAILAGGNARRLGGCAKGAVIEVESGVSIAQNLVNEFRRAGISDIAIIANNTVPYQNLGAEVVPDIRPGNGPVAGIETALSMFNERSDAIMFVPCDLPQITASEIKTLLKAFIEEDAMVVFAETGDFFWHPLCAVVHNDMKRNISAAINNGERKIRSIWEKVKAISVHFSDDKPFFNINNIADLRQWEQIKGSYEASVCSELVG